MLSMTMQIRKRPWTISNREFEASCWRLRTKYAALLLLTSKPSRGARAALGVAGAICA